MSDKTKKDVWKIVTDPNDPSLMRMFLNGHEFEVNSFGLGKRNKKGKCVMKLEVLIDLNQLTTINATKEGHGIIWRETREKFLNKNKKAEPPPLPIAIYHHADAEGKFLPSESCVCEDDVYTNNEHDDSIGVPLVRLSDALAAIAKAKREKK